MARGGGSKNHPRSILRAKEMSKVLDLVLAGMSYRRIAAEMEISLGKVAELVDEGRKSIPAVSRDALIVEIHQVELAIRRAHWTKRGDPRSAAVIQASNKALRDMFGLDAPKATIAANFEAGTIEDSPEALAAAVRELFGEKAARPHGDAVDAAGAGAGEGPATGRSETDTGSDAGDSALRAAPPGTRNQGD